MACWVEATASGLKRLSTIKEVQGWPALGAPFGWSKAFHFVCFKSQPLPPLPLQYKSHPKQQPHGHASHSLLSSFRFQRRSFCLSRPHLRAWQHNRRASRRVFRNECIITALSRRRLVSRHRIPGLHQRRPGHAASVQPYQRKHQRQQ